jgi:hypothetical protein
MEYNQLRLECFAMNFAEVCHKILELDSSLRFSAVANSDGKIVAAVYREGTTPLLTREESELSIMQSVIRMSIRRTLERKLGRISYAVAIYQKVTRATISLIDQESKREAYLLISLDPDADYKSVITLKILPLLEKENGSTKI